MSKSGKRRVVSLAATVTTLTIYIPLMGTAWGIYAAMSAGYTATIFGLAWSDGKLERYFGEGSGSSGKVLQTHVVFLLLVVGWIWFVQFVKPSLPLWVVVEGDSHESWFLFFSLLGIIGLLIAELSWLAKPAERDEQVGASPQ